MNLNMNDVILSYNSVLKMKNNKQKNSRRQNAGSHFAAIFIN